MFKPKKEEKQLHSILFIFFFIFMGISLFLNEAFAFEDGYKYLKLLDNNTKVDWTINEDNGDWSCDNASKSNNDLINRVISRCKVITETEHKSTTDNVQSTFLMDSKGNIFYAKDFDPVHMVKIGSEYGLILIRHNEKELLLLIDQNGEFRESYAISGQILDTTHDHYKKDSNYYGLLVGLGRDLRINKCTQDILTSLTQDYVSKIDEYGYNYLEDIKEYGLFYDRLPLQIEVVLLPKRVTDVEHVNINSIIKDQIDQQITYVRLQQQEVGVKKDDSARFMVFLSLNATNNETLKELVDKYGEYIDKDIAAIYKNTVSCM